MENLYVLILLWIQIIICSTVLNIQKIQVIKNIYPNFSNIKKKYIDKKYIKNIKISEYNKFIQDGSKYLPFLKKAKYIKSFYVVRAVKLNKERTDERTNEITKINKKIFTILSGKWNTCVSIALKLEKILMK